MSSNRKLSLVDASSSFVTVILTPPVNRVSKIRTKMISEIYVTYNMSENGAKFREYAKTGTRGTEFCNTKFFKTIFKQKIIKNRLSVMVEKRVTLFPYRGTYLILVGHLALENQLHHLPLLLRHSSKNKYMVITVIRF